MIDDPELDLIEMLAELRGRGWSIAVHNDYRVRGERCTFWLFTHPEGFWLKGEGPTDHAAVAVVLARMPEAMAKERFLNAALDLKYAFDAKKGGPINPVQDARIAEALTKEEEAWQELKRLRQAGRLG